MRFCIVSFPVLMLVLCSTGCREDEVVRKLDQPKVEGLLDEEGRAMIWEVERQVNYLKADGLSQISEALASGQREVLSNCFSDRFEGAVPFSGGRKGVPS
ncbi:MAG: hypothetical protein ACON5N_14430 [Akkermansiaceae bacterium]